MLKLSKTIIIIQLKGTVTSNYKSKIHDYLNRNSKSWKFHVNSFPSFILRLLTRKEFVKYGNS